MIYFTCYLFLKGWFNRPQAGDDVINIFGQIGVSWVVWPMGQMGQISKWFHRSKDNNNTQHWYKFHYQTPISTQLLSILIFCGRFDPGPLWRHAGVKLNKTYTIRLSIHYWTMVVYLISIITFPYMAIFPDVPIHRKCSRKNGGRYSGIVYCSLR